MEEVTPEKIKVYSYPRSYGSLRVAAKDVPDFLAKISHIVENPKAELVRLDNQEEE